MTALRSWGWALGLSLCGCGARTDDGGRLERSTPAITTQPAQQASTSGAPQPSADHPYTASAAVELIRPASAPPPSGCCAPIDQHEVPPPALQPAPSEPPRPDAGAAPPPASNSCFEYLGDWITCENAGWPNVEQTSAPDLQGCMELCQQRPDCTAVTDYFWLGRPDLGCWLYTSTCSAPAGGVWQEEDGGRQYRKRCATP
jgi:hypothetical protein